MNRHDRRKAAAGGGKKEPPSRVVKVMAFYRDDMPTGAIAVTMEFQENEGNLFAASAQKAMLLYDAHATPEGCFAQLEEWALTKPEDAIERIIVTIHWLERRGHLRSDDHNGVLWCALKGRDLVMLREDQWTEKNLKIVEGAGQEVNLLDRPEFERQLREILHTPAAD
jgi:hypothetical protein